MANRRMFSQDVVCTDRFLEMSATARLLYFQLGMKADDDGFVASPVTECRIIGAAPDDLKMLAVKGYIIPFDSGVVVITDWLVSNQIRGQRYKPTRYQTERKMLVTEKELDPTRSEHGRYLLRQDVPALGSTNGSTNGITNGSTDGSTDGSTQYRLGKYSIERGGKNTSDDAENDPEKARKEGAKRPARARFERPTVEEVTAYCREKGYTFDPEQFVAHYDANGWKLSGNLPMVDWKAACRTWQGREADYHGKQQTTSKPAVPQLTEEEIYGD